MNRRSSKCRGVAEWCGFDACLLVQTHAFSQKAHLSSSLSLSLTFVAWNRAHSRQGRNISHQRQQRLNVSLEKAELVGTDGKLVKFSKRDDERYGMTCKAKTCMQLNQVSMAHIKKD